MPTERLHQPFLLLLLASVVVAAAIMGSTTGPPRDRSHDQPRLAVIRSAVTHRPNIGQLLTECALTLADFPAPSQLGNDMEESVRVVQEPYMEPVRAWTVSTSYHRYPCSCLLWFLNGEHGNSFQDGDVLGYVDLREPRSIRSPALADVAPDPQRNQYWVAIAEGGWDLALRLYLVSSDSVLASSRTALVNARSKDWPPPSQPIAFTTVQSGTGFGSAGNCQLVTMLTRKAEFDSEGECLVIQARSTDDFDDRRPQVKLWTWRYSMDQRAWLSQTEEDVPRLDRIPTEREKNNGERMEQWMSVVMAEHERRMEEARLGREAILQNSAKVSPP